MSLQMYELYDPCTMMYAHSLAHRTPADSHLAQVLLPEQGEYLAWLVVRGVDVWGIYSRKLEGNWS